MSKQRYDVSRRKLLGSLGTVGGAAALGGAGSMAFFSDEENVANNRLVAGALDLKLAWQELYFGAEAEAEFDSGAFSTEDIFGDSTATVEAYPDGGVTTFDDLNTQDACSQADLYADTPEDLDPTNPGSERTQNGDTYDGSLPKPLISIQDAKPGDFGFTRFRLLLCDNPGYVWTTGGIQSLAENDLTEPERKDDDQPGGGGAGAAGQLADEIRVQLVQAESGAAIENLFGSISASSGGELVQEVFETFGLDDPDAPTLREFSNAISGSPGFPLTGDPFGGGAAGQTIGDDSVFVYDLSDGGAQQQDRECFEAAGGAGQVAIVWALPVDHANEIQTDAVSVDVGFYTEQCRHNDGSGIGTS